MFANTLSDNTLRGLKIIGQDKLLDFAYLAGGTALALRLGHRQSVDLDFFTQEKFDEQVILQEFQKTKKFKAKQIAWRTITGTFNKVRFSLFYYQYPLLGKSDRFEGVDVVNLKDIAAMKIHAVGDRGTKRDFIDLYFLAQEFSLQEMFSFYDQKYGKLEERKYHLLRSLSYFEDADTEEPPTMLKPVEWKKIKQFFAAAVKRLGKDLLLS